MAKITKGQSRSLVYRYLLTEGWLPPGTNEQTWGDVKLGDLAMDDPPLPGSPHAQKTGAALDIQNLFVVLGSGIPSPLAEIKKKSLTLHELADWCFENQQ